MSLTGSDLDKLLRLLREVAGEPSLEQGIQGLLKGGVELFGADHAVIGHRSPDDRHRIWWWPEQIDFSAHNQAYEALVDEHPVRSRFLATRTHEPILLSDCVNLERWESSALFSDYFRHYGVRRMLAVYAPIGPGSHLSLGLARSGSDFSDRERVMAQILQPTLVSLAVRLLRASPVGPGQGQLSRPVARVKRSIPANNLLTARETEVWMWMAQGKTNAEISVILGCARATVKNHAERILSKLGVETRTAAARHWFEGRA